MKDHEKQAKSLKDLDLQGYGHFEPDRKATFTIDTLDLPDSWEFIYRNGDIVLRVDQFGPISAQVDPPKDIVLFRREQYQPYSSWLTWLRSPRFKCGAFTNFFRPLVPGKALHARPDHVAITFAPSKATYTIEYEGLRSSTEVFVPAAGPTVCLNVSLTNLGESPLQLSATPVLRPYVNPAMLAPWDKPEWYLKTGFCMSDKPGFWTHLLNMNSDFDKRRVVVLWSDSDHLVGAEISHEKFTGHGTFESPQAVLDGRLRLSPADGAAWGRYRERNSLFGYPPVNALQYSFSLTPGETLHLRQALSAIPCGPDGTIPDFEVARESWRLLESHHFETEQGKVDDRYTRLANSRSIETPDRCLNRYVNEWLPLQLDWVCSLDRGWPTGMHGSRDSANDFAAMVPLDPRRCCETMETILSCQRTDGWFPRQYSAAGRKGSHDLRGYVDAGCVIIGLLYEYLCFSKDLEFLEHRLPWLDSDGEDIVLEHAIRAVDFYIKEQNLGEHGLCKIGEGDWLDAVNRAGCRGRGESVTVTNQVIIALTQLSLILENLKSRGAIPVDRVDSLLDLYAWKKQFLADNLRTHALNREGYFNSVFNDDGQWLFSDCDPDGRRRVYGPANWFSIISGVAVPDLVDPILGKLEVLKCEAGYRLFWPPMGETPILEVGRIGTGDVPAGLNENATPYNHGAHGFLARALAVAGKGDLLYEVLQYLLPYDQEKHPVAKTLSPPYAVVNTWNDVPLFHHRGGMRFLTGSVAYALRIAHSWMYGIKPLLQGLTIDPCIPAEFKDLCARFRYLEKEVELEIHNPDGREAGVRSMSLNGGKIEETFIDPFSGRKCFVADDNLLDRPENKIEVTLSGHG